MLPLVSCPHCTRLIKLQRKDCDRIFFHSQCGATIRVPKYAEVRDGAKLTVASPPDESGRKPIDALPERTEAGGLAPRQLKPDRNRDPDRVADGEIEIADVVAQLAQLSAGLATLANQLQQIVARRGGGAASHAEEAAAPGEDDATNGQPEEPPGQATNANLIKGRADGAALKERYRNLEEVDELKLGEDGTFDSDIARQRHVQRLSLERIAAWENDPGTVKGSVSLHRSPKWAWATLVFVGAVAFVAAAWLAVNAIRLGREDLTQLLKETPSHQTPVLEPDTARSLVARFYQAGSIDEILACVRTPDRIRPLAAAYYKSHPFSEVRLLPGIEIHPVKIELQDFFLVRYQLADELEPRSAMIEPTPEGPRIDWEHAVAHCEWDWDALTETRPAKPALFRLQAAPAEHFDETSPDPLEYLCLRIQDANGNPRGYAYVRKDSFVAEGMRNLFRFQSSGIKRDTVVRVTLRLKPLAPERFMVTEIVSGSWMVP